MPRVGPGLPLPNLPVVFPWMSGCRSLREKEEREGEKGVRLPFECAKLHSSPCGDIIWQAVAPVSLDYGAMLPNSHLGI